MGGCGLDEQGLWRGLGGGRGLGFRGGADLVSRAWKGGGAGGG